MIRVMTSNRAVSLQVVAMDITRVGQGLGLDISWFDRMFTPQEIRKSNDAAVIIMPCDPLYAAPWILLARDLTKGGVKNVYYCPVEGKVNRRFVQSWMREVSYVAVSNYVKEKLLEAGLRVLDAVPHGVDIAAAVSAKRHRRLALEYFYKHGLDPEKHTIVLTVSNAHPRKGLAWYDKIIVAVEKRDPNVKFLVITEEKGLDYFSKHSSLVVSTDFGKLPRVSILSLIAHTHIFALPSLSEGFGLPVLECMALGTPVVHGELPPLMEFSTGFAVPIKEIKYFDRSEVGPSGIVYEQHLYDVEEFAEVLLQVVDIVRNRKDVLEDWRARSFEKAKQFDIHVVYPRLLKYVA